jgi:hypothetical protein
MDVAEAATVGTPSAPRHAVFIAGTIGLASVLWFALLSGWLGVVPGSVMVKRQNVLFNSDTNSWIDEMAHGHEPSTKAVHPLQVYLWRPPCQALAHLFQLFLPPERAGLLAARLLVALVAGTGVGFLALVALRNGVELTQCLLLFSMYLLFTSSSTIALPEHFGISNGLLSIAFAVPIVIAHPRVRTAVLAALVPLCGGTTITNLLFPLASLYQYSVRSARTRRAILAAAPVAVGVAIFLFADSQNVVLSHRAILPAYIPGITRLYAKSTMIHSHVFDYLHLRLLLNPQSATVYAIFALVAPAIGPTPVVRTIKGVEMVTYESSGRPLHWSPFGVTGSDGVHLGDYWGVQAVGAATWIVLLLWCSYQALRDRGTRSLVWLPVGWILFNIVFHNIWGDELFLYAAHWSWALMGLVILGARRLSRTAAASLVIPVMVSQVYTLLRIKSALLTILR